MQITEMRDKMIVNKFPYCLCVESLYTVYGDHGVVATGYNVEDVVEGRPKFYLIKGNGTLKKIHFVMLRPCKTIEDLPDELKNGEIVWSSETEQEVV